MKKFNFIIIILLAIVLGLSIYIAVQPDDSAFVGSKRIEADPQLVFENVNNLEKWKAWSPWYRMSDSLTTESLGTSVSGEGAQLEWSSGAHIGKVGILKNRPMDSLWHTIKIDNVPQAYSYWSFKRVSNGTEVSWGIDRNRIPFLLKCYAVINGGLDKVFAAEYELGLTRLDSVLRMETAKFSVDIQGIREYSGSFYVYKKASVPRDQLRQKMRAQYDSILRFLNTNNIPTNGSPMTVYEAFSVDKDTVVFHHGITVRERVVIENDSTIFCDFVDNQNVLKATLKGNYSNLQKAWAQALMYLEVNEIKPSGKMPFEIYANDPSALPNPAEWITEIYVPIK